MIPTRLAFARRYVRDELFHRRKDWLRPVRPAPHRPDPASWPADALAAAWLGHATVLLNLHGTWLLTDPVLRTRIGFDLRVTAFGPRRLVGPALGVRELPRLDVLLISHAHMDHLDPRTLRQLPSSLPVVAHASLRDLLGHFTDVTELRWGERTRVGDVTIEATPAKHWGARILSDGHRGYGGFLLERGGTRVLYTGDTAATDLFRRYADPTGVDLAILPIGAYNPWIANHASPEQAWQIGRDLRAQHVLPVHHSTFRLSREPLEEPIARLLRAAGGERERIVLTEVGQSWVRP
jgi:L-ascorbate metabolism protein UlaG (beta-lactamase superfamily)